MFVASIYTMRCEKKKNNFHLKYECKFKPWDADFGETASLTSFPIVAANGAENELFICSHFLQIKSTTRGKKNNTNH